MNTYEIIVTVILLVAYSVFSVWTITRFKKLSTGIAGSLCIATGGVGVYLSGAIIAAALLWLLKALLVIGAIALFVAIFGS
jgi:hypothetical protein